DQGATFTVELRTVEAEPTGAAAPRPADTSGRLEPILLVEDNVDSATAIAEFLRVHGYAVKVATTMKQAMDLYARGDLAISDIGLPDGSGHELLRRISGDGAVSAIALSGYG